MAEPAKFSMANCSNLLHNGAAIEANADISGVGVVSAFILSAYLTFTAVLVAYLFGLVDSGLLSPVDRRVFHIRPFPSRSTGTASNGSAAQQQEQQVPSKRRKKAEACLRTAVLALSDQQIVTGIAIMGAGFQGLRTGALSAYHYQIVLYLAWMSSSVHLTAITVLASYLKSHRGVLAWRLAGMLVLFVMLVVGLVPTISNDWGVFWWPGIDSDKTGWAIPARCFWGDLKGGAVSPDAPLGFMILSVSYLWKMGQLFSSSRGAYHRWFRGPIERFMVRTLRFAADRCSVPGGFSWFWLWTFRLLLALTLPFMVMFEVVSSFAASLWLSLMGLIFGTIQVLIPRSQMQPMTQSQEGTWGFGQLVPLILLIQPLGMVLEHVWTREPHDDNALELLRYTRTIPDSRDTQSEPKRELSLEGQHNQYCFQQVLLAHISKHPNAATWSHEHIIVKNFLFSSKVFAFLVWLVQAAVVTICTVVFHFDSLTIGNERASNWEFILDAIAAFIAVGVLTTLVVSPYSRTGRMPHA
ncbi:ArfGap-domain-containing protein [Apiospora saccharicola]|uniref:ArfGap-domain-containing protein n=1 Tax=Apiospora saccharicola TaxID=335842 RepID=A0ABR1U4Q9_9PEZI